MKINLSFKGSAVEFYEFDNNYDKELYIFITNPFKLGIGFKYRVINKQETVKGDYVNPKTGYKEPLVEYYKASIKGYIWSIMYFLKKPFGFLYNIKDLQIAKGEINES